MSEIETKNQKKEKTIRGETTKAFLLIFGILATVGVFTIYTSIKGAGTFDSIRKIHLQQFKAAEVMKQQALDIIGIYYLLGSDQDMEILMEQLKRYDGLVEEFDKASQKVREAVAAGSETEDTKKIISILDANKKLFADMNNNCRQMTFALMENKKEEGKKFFNLVSQDIKEFKSQTDEIEAIAGKKLEAEADMAQDLMQTTTWMGIGITILAIFVSLGLIYALMKFLSVSLLPISNLMHNMRQAVFSIDSTGNVVSPVSKYSGVVFDDDIVGKSVYDVVYRDIDPNSEMMAQAKMGLVSTFGEDDLQWMMTEDCLPKQVTRKLRNPASKELEDRILKLTYTPLWNKEGKLQNIMIVAEDVSEIEKLRQEALKKQDEIAILQGIVNMGRNDLESFLEDSHNKIHEAMAQIPLLSSSAEARQLLFRILHTLKGNSRMYNLNVISEVVHHVENSVVQMNQTLDNKEPLTEEMITNLKSGLNEIEHVCASHSKQAKKLFGMKDLYGGKKEEQLHQSLSSLEIALQLSITSDKSHLTENGEASEFSQVSLGIEKSIEQAVESADYFDCPELKQSLLQLKEKSKDSPENWKPALFQVGEHYSLASIRFGFSKEYSLDQTKWISIFQKLIELTSKYETALQAKSSSDLYQDLQKDITLAVNLADAESFAFPRLQFVKMSWLMSLGTKEGQLPDLKPLFTSLWNYMASVCSVDATCNLDEKNWIQFSTGFSSLPAHEDQIVAALDHLPAKTLLFASLLRSLARKSFFPQQFRTLAAKYIELQDHRKVESYFLGFPGEKEILENFSSNLKTASFTKESLVQGLESSHFWSLNSLLKSDDFYGQLRFDMTRLFAAHFRASHEDSFENESQTIKIPVQSFNEIKSQVMKIEVGQGQPSSTAAELAEAILRIQKAVKQALDVPVKSICKKMDSMVKELAGRLDKDIQFKITGDDITIGREESYQLRDALVHIIRNSLDHGIETREERKNSGKSDKAVIEINCKKIRDGFELAVRDDGRGINTEKVTAKAVSLGLISLDKVQKMTNEEKLQLIFIPNLSTKEEVTSLSGRGVGMDAVKKTIEEMNGEVSVVTNLGVGTEFRLRVFEHSKSLDQGLHQKTA